MAEQIAIYAIVSEAELFIDSALNGIVSLSSSGQVVVYSLSLTQSNQLTKPSWDRAITRSIFIENGTRSIFRLSIVFVRDLDDSQIERITGKSLDGWLHCFNAQEGSTWTPGSVVARLRTFGIQDMDAIQVARSVMTFKSSHSLFFVQ